MHILKPQSQLTDVEDPIHCPLQDCMNFIGVAQTPSTMNFTSFSGNKRTVTSDVARRADFNEIPIISLASPKKELIAQLTDACTRVGFFYIKDHNVPQEKIDNLFKTAESFFALDDEKKDEINYKKSKILRGYEPPAEVRTDETRKPDLNEAFNWGYEKALDPEWSGGDDAQGAYTRLWRGEYAKILSTSIGTVEPRVC